LRKEKNILAVTVRKGHKKREEENALSILRPY